VARVLIVGAPGRAGELASSGHVVEEADGADPERLATLTPRLEGVGVVCWLFGEAGSDVLHGDRLGALLEYLVDTPVRGFVYERSREYPRGEEIVARARATFRLPCVVVDHGADLGEAVVRVLAAQP
jgi:hypothetical protein